MKVKVISLDNWSVWHIHAVWHICYILWWFLWDCIDVLKIWSYFITSLRCDFFALSVGLKICWLYSLERRKNSFKKGVSDGEVPDLESVEFPFIAITPRSTMTHSGSTCYGPIYRSNRSVKNCSYVIGQYAKKKLLRNNYTKNVNMNMTS